MDLATVTMEPEAAKLLYEEYLALGSRTTAEDVAIKASYREIMRGHPLLDIEKAIPAGGHDELGRPLLAFARADEAEIVCRRSGLWIEGSHHSGIGDLSMFPSGTSSWDRVAASRHLDLIAAEFDGWPVMPKDWWALVPTIPAALRPRGDLSRYHIIWEAEWMASSKLRVAPRDPALLRHITGSLYAVLAVWDLTEVERLVLGMRQA